MLTRQQIKEVAEVYTRHCPDDAKRFRDGRGTTQDVRKMLEIAKTLGFQSEVSIEEDMINGRR